MSEAAPVVPVRKPFSIAVGAPAHAALSELVAHARNGYTVSDAPIELMPNGYLFFSINLGDPIDYHIQKSKESAEVALATEERERQQAIKDEARRIVEEEKREALAKQVAALKAEQAKALRDLERANAAAIAKLQ